MTEPGDLLYLPPGIRHDGVAITPCFTYSIGFRAPRGAELAAAFLDWLHSRGLPDAVYRDPGLRPSSQPARIPPAMIGFAQSHLAKIRWSRTDAIAFLGAYLTGTLKDGTVNILNFWSPIQDLASIATQWGDANGASIPWTGKVTSGVQMLQYAA